MVNTGTICGLPRWIGIIGNDTATYINNIVLATVNVPFAIFAFLSNLAIIVTIIKKPSLQKPCNILLCSLAIADCLTGITSQPMFVVWRLTLQRAQQSCLHQVLIFDVYYILNVLTSGLSFLYVTIISFDRYYALSRPLAYHVQATKKGALKIVIYASIIWMLLTVLTFFVLPMFFYIVGVTAIIIYPVLFLVVPIVNYIRMFFAIRRHNSQLGDAVASQQMSAIFQRETKVALDMCIVAILFFVSLTPPLVMMIVELLYPRLHAIALPWSLAVALMTSSINPVIYFGRNKNLISALKSMMSNKFNLQEHTVS